MKNYAKNLKFLLTNHIPVLCALLWQFILVLWPFCDLCRLFVANIRPRPALRISAFSFVSKTSPILTLILHMLKMGLTSCK